MNETNHPSPSTSATMNAVGAAFAYVACADGRVDEAEINRVASFVQSVQALREEAPTNLAAILQNYATPFLEDFSKAEANAHEAIAQIRGNPDASSLVIRAAQIAIVADQELHRHEEIALERICTTLGVPADGF